MNAPRKPAGRSRRLRKKLHLDEFQELGFRVRFVFATPTDAIAHLRFWDRFLSDAIEAHGLTYGGGNEGFAMPGSGSATEAQREYVRAWLLARDDVSEVEVGPLVDAWYAPDDAPAT